MTAAQNLWDPIRAIRDLGTVDISPTVAVNAAGDEKQTATIVLTLSLDDASLLAGDLEFADLSYWRDTVTEIRKALGLAGAWVEFQDGTL